MNVFFVRAFLAIVGLGLILSAVCLFAEEHRFVSATRTIWHHLNLKEDSQSCLGAAGLNHIYISLCIYYI
jgi:hypothetical protein